MIKVIVLEPTALDLSAAEEFGELVYISKYRFNLFNIDDIIQKTQIELNSMKYDPMEDLICLTGAAQKIAIFVAAVANLNLKFTLLIFDAREAKYKKRIFRNDNIN